MKKKICLTICSLLLSGVCLFSQIAPGGDDKIPAGLADAAMHHIESLAGLGGREAGSANEAKALIYIEGEFRKMGLITSREDFEFSLYLPGEFQLRIGTERLTPEYVGFDAYNAKTILSGPTACVAPQLPREEMARLDLAGKIVITTQPANRFQLAMKKPRAVVFLSAEDFARGKKTAAASAELRSDGRIVKKRSANLVTGIPASFPASRRILVSAHYDAVGGPGASDNASGVALLLEIARYFQQRMEHPGLELEFAALGAEEVGMLGAKAFLSRHAQTLDQYELVFNIDTVGGGEGIYIEMRAGVEGVSRRRGVSQIPAGLADKAQNDGGNRWGWLPPELAFIASCVPPWLQQEINAAAAELNCAFTPSNYMGSDHLIFAQAGIPATDIACGGSATHGPGDTVDKISRGSLQKVAALVIRVIEKTMAGRMTKN